MFLCYSLSGAMICSPMSQSKQVYWKRSGIPPNEPQTRPETFLLHRHMINFVLSNNFSRQAGGQFQTFDLSGSILLRDLALISFPQVPAVCA